MCDEISEEKHGSRDMKQINKQSRQSANKIEKTKVEEAKAKAGEVKDKAVKGVVNVVFGRTAFFVLLLIIQVILLGWGLLYLSDYAWYVYGISVAVSVVVVIVIINEKSNPAYKLAWMLPVLLIPFLGSGFYIFCRSQKTVEFFEKRLDHLWYDIRPYMAQNDIAFERMKKDNPSNANLSHFLYNQVGYPLHQNSDVTYFSSGEEKYESILMELAKARKYIFLEYFIIARGQVWDSILEILKKKAKEGVEVRLMYDGTCSLSLLPYDYPKQMKRFGIKCKMFHPIKPILTTSQNNRDHRKICVIDGRVAYTGGINLADEYINAIERFGHWKDTAIMVEGEAVQSFIMMFLQLWNMKEKQEEDYEKYLVPKSKIPSASLGYVIPYGDSPYDNENVGEQVYTHILNHAKSYVHIMSPYLILDYEMMSTLMSVAKSGIEVIIVMPSIPDKWYAFVLAKTYYAELIGAGVQIYEYTPGFVHAKMFISDDDTAVVGTINLDYRSLYLHFECGAFIYRNPVVREIEEDFQDTLEKCHKLTLVEVNNRPLKDKVCGHIFRLIAPLM